MAWRLHVQVLRGRIDNRARGCVTGEIWLAGIDQPLVLELKGDCAPDVAGCELSFEILTLFPGRRPLRSNAGLSAILRRRESASVRVPIVERWRCADAAAPPEHIAHSLYLVFCERSGR